MAQGRWIAGGKVQHLECQAFGRNPALENAGRNVATHSQKALRVDVDC